MAEHYELGPNRSQGLVDVLDRILDKGLMIAGDIRIQLADVELLTIQIRLLVCSLDKAEQIGMNWWKTDPRLSTHAQGGDRLVAKIDELSHRLQVLEQKLVREG